MTAGRYVIRRLLILFPQVFGATTIVFVLIRLLPGDPAYMIAGSLATKDVIDSIRQQLGLDRPIWEQYLIYLGNVAQGDLGKSWLTSSRVTEDILQRLPATLELITLALILAFCIALPLGVLTALRPGTIVDRLASAYGMLAGAMPDFWWALFLVFVLFGQLQVVPAPIGRIDLALLPPPQVTGFYTVDSMLSRDWAVLWSSLTHLALPAFTLAFVYAGPILKMARATMSQALRGNFIQYARASGLPRHIIARYALRNALLPVITMTGITYGYLIGGAVLIEQIFAWGGLGQYAVQAITSSDYMAVSGVVLTTTLFSLLVYLAVDLLISPSIRASDTEGACMGFDVRHLRYMIRTEPGALLGAAIVAVALVLAVIGPAIAPFDPRTAIPGNQLRPPSLTHLMGTDANGMDVFSRVIASPQTDLTIAVLGTLGAIVVGVPLGLIAGYYRGFASELLMRISDIVQSFPVFILGMALVVVTGQEIKNVIYVVAVVNCPIYIRLVRSQALFLRERPFIEAARAIGGRDRWIIREHILPNAIGPVVANASVTIGWAILLTAGLSFIGAGVRVPTPEWGSMIAVGAKNVYTGEWWTSVFPGLALAVTVLGFALLGETLVRMTDRTRR